MKKKMMCVLCAALLALSFGGCGDKSEESSKTVVTYDTGFNFDEGFACPTTPPACEYTYTPANISGDVFSTFVETAFGDGVFGRGQYSEGAASIANEDDLPTYEWFDEQAQQYAFLQPTGVLAFYDGSQSVPYQDEETHIADTVFTEDFDKTVTLKDKSASYKDLSFMAQEKLYDIFAAIGRDDIKIKPVFAREYKNESDKTRSVTISYCIDFGTAQLTFNSSPHSDGSILIRGTTMVFPLIKASFYSTENMQGASVLGMLVDNVKQGKTAEIMSCEDALKAANKGIELSPKDYTIHYAQLEYMPVSTTTDECTASPFWVFYYTYKGEETGVITVNAVSGEIDAFTPNE